MLEMMSACCKDRLNQCCCYRNTQNNSSGWATHIPSFHSSFTLESFLRVLSSWEGTSSSLPFIVVKEKKKYINSSPQAIRQTGRKNKHKQNQVSSVLLWLTWAIVILLKKHLHTGRPGNHSLTLKAFNYKTCYHLFLPGTSPLALLWAVWHT